MAAVSETSITISHVNKCLICLDTINEADLLSCLHTFCAQCLTNYCSANIESDDKVECPICSRIFLIPHDGVNDVTNNNFFSNQLLDVKKSTELFPLKTSTSCELCSDAEVEIPSTSYCIECDQRMCDRCSMAHTKTKMCKSHQVMRDNDEGRAVKTPERITTSVNTCNQHPHEVQGLYCYDCKRVMCHKCTRKPDKHALSDVKESMKKFGEQLMESVDKLSACTCLEQEDIIQLETDKMNFMKIVNSTRSEIIRKYEQLVSIIQSQRSQLIKELDGFKDKVLKEIETKRREIERLFVMREKFKRYCLAMMDKGTTCDISRTARDLHTRLEELVVKREYPDCRKLSDVNVTLKPFLSTDVCVNNFIGELIFDSKAVDQLRDEQMGLPKLLDKTTLLHAKRIKLPVAGMTVLGRYVFIVSKTSHIDVYRCNDLSFCRRIPIAGSTDLRGVVSCSHYNCLYVCHYKRAIIYRYGIASNRTSAWSTTGPCYALSVAKTDHNVIAYRSVYRAQLIEEYTTRGSLLKEIRLDGSVDYPRHCIKLPSGNYVVSHSGNGGHRVCLVDQSGRLIGSFGGKQGLGHARFNNPCQLAVDKYDNVLVADYYNNRVRLLSPTLSLLGDIEIPTIRLSFPNALHVDELNRRVYVGERDESRVIVVGY